MVSAAAAQSGHVLAEEARFRALGIPLVRVIESDGPESIRRAVRSAHRPDSVRPAVGARLASPAGRAFVEGTVGPSAWQADKPEQALEKLRRAANNEERRALDTLSTPTFDAVDHAIMAMGEMGAGTTIGARWAREEAAREALQAIEDQMGRADAARQPVQQDRETARRAMIRDGLGNSWVRPSCEQGRQARARGEATAADALRDFKQGATPRQRQELERLERAHGVEGAVREVDRIFDEVFGDDIDPWSGYGRWF